MITEASTRLASICCHGDKALVSGIHFPSSLFAENLYTAFQFTWVNHCLFASWCGASVLTILTTPVFIVLQMM